MMLPLQVMAQQDSILRHITSPQADATMLKINYLKESARE